MSVVCDECDTDTLKYPNTALKCRQIVSFFPNLNFHSSIKMASRGQWYASSNCPEFGDHLNGGTIIERGDLHENEKLVVCLYIDTS